MPRLRACLALLPLLVNILLALFPVPCTAAGNWTWIWATDGAHPPETLYFRQRFRLARKPLSARLLITADDIFVAYLNEDKTPVGTGSDWTTVQEFDVGRYLKAGENLLAVQCRNTGGPGGLLYKLIVKETASQTRTYFSDGRVRVNRHPPILWTTFALNDSEWPKAAELAPANGGVWGQLRGAPMPDPSRIVRLWDIRAGGTPGADPYTRPRNIGERMLMSASVASASDMQILAGAGFSLFQSDSNHLSTEEVAPIKWDWQRADAARALVQSLGLDWCYFEHEAFPPKWYRDSVAFTRIQCMEHHQPVQAFSLWDSKWPGFIEQGYQALAKAFGPRQPQVAQRTSSNAVKSGNTEAAFGIENRKSKIENLASLVSALCVGVHGDYGEAGLLNGGRVDVPGQREDWIRRFGNAHDHLGFWCDDPAARADFRATMLKKHGTLYALNAAWNTNYQTPQEIAYPSDLNQEPDTSQRYHYLDFIDWYREGVGRAIEANLAQARKRFPNTLLMLPAGFRDENLRGGNDNSLIPKLAARYGAAVRSTHGGFKPFADNAATMFGRLGSACRFYGAPFWTEPPGSLTPEQTVERIYEAASQGAAGYFDWASNAVANRDVYYRYGKFLRIDRPIVDVAMFYPARAQELRPEQGYQKTFAQACAYLRDIADFDIVDDRMIDDGCLSGYRVLALWEGTLCDPVTLEKIKAWVDSGGVLVAYDFGKVTTFSGDTSWYKDLFGYNQDLVPARLNEHYVGNVPVKYRIDVGKSDQAGYLDGNWYEPTTENGVPGRWTGATATVRLPVDPDKSYALVVRVVVPPDAANLKHEVLLNGHKLGDLSPNGDVRYRFLVPDGALDNGSLATLSFESDTFQPAKLIPGSKDIRSVGVRVESVELSELGADEGTEAPPPSGVIRRELDLSYLSANASNASWVRRYGSGLTIYFPANRSLMKGYIEVLRRAIYHLSAIDPSRRDALPIDDDDDGVYATLFSDKILYYNSLDTTITKTVTIPLAAFAAWKNDVLTPSENTWTVELKPHSIEAIYFTPPSQELLYECEGFTDLGGLKPAAAADCSPGTGLTCVHIPPSSSISTRFRAGAPGRYNVFVRCLQGANLEPVDVLIDNQPVAPVNRKVGQTLLAGNITLIQGTHSLTLRARPGHSVRADFVLLSNDPTVAGYSFAVRTAPVE